MGSERVDYVILGIKIEKDHPIAQMDYEARDEKGLHDNAYHGVDKYEGGIKYINDAMCGRWAFLGKIIVKAEYDGDGFAPRELIATLSEFSEVAQALEKLGCIAPNVQFWIVTLWH